MNLEERGATLKAVRDKYPVYKDMSDDELAAGLASKYPQYKDLVHPWKATSEQALRAGKDPSVQLPGGEKLEHPAEVIGMGASLAVPGAGSLAAKALPQFPKLAAAGGRAIASGLIGGGEAAAKGEGGVKRGLADAGVAATFEALLGGATHMKIPKFTSSLKDLAGRVTGRREEFARATDAVDKAFDAIAGRVPQGKFLYVPALSANKMSADEVRAALKKPDLPGATYEAARKQVHQELLAMDKRAAKSPAIGQNLYTATDFGKQTLPKKFQPPSSGGERFAEQAIKVLENPATRAGADVGATQDVSGLPAGSIPLLMGLESLPSGSSLRGVAERAIRH